MAGPTFIHLHVHTAYSLLEGAMKTGKLAHAVREMGMPAVAMTDSGNMFGAMAITADCCAEGVQPILGTQLLIKTPNLNPEDAPTFDKVVLLVKDKTGWLNILKLFTSYYMGADKQQTPHLTLDELCAGAEGLICLTGGAGGILERPLLRGQAHVADETTRRLLSAFTDRLYIEIQRHGLETERQTEPNLIDLAYAHNIPLVATNDVYFLTPDMYEAHDALICIAEKSYVVEQNRRRLTPEHYLKTPAQMAELFADLPEAIANTIVVARRCHFMTEKQKPAFPNYDCQGKTENEVLADQAHAGLKLRMAGRTPAEADAYAKQLEYELDIIGRMGFAGYFLIVADFIQWSKRNGVPVGPGRGSGAGSVAAWALTITNIDPLRFNLLFERFLNPERVSMPDFDIDFCQENRGKTIEYVQKKYGNDHVAQIITFGKLQAKAVIRDVGRVLQIPYPVVDRLSKLVPNGLNDKGKPFSLTEAIAMEPEFDREAKADENIGLLLEIALKLEGLYRNASTHAAGVVIGNKPLNQILPIYKDPQSDMPVTQFDMKFVEDASLIKFDFLGLKTLTVIEKAIALIKNRGVAIDMDALPLDDADTFRLLCAANTSGVFQLESAGMRQILTEMQPDKIEDIIALVSLYRPGPMSSIPSYIARKKGLEKPDYMHPMLEEILRETHGIMIYQEQVMQISQKMAGYTLGAADLLRRAMGKKKKEEMDTQRTIFIEGAVKNGVAKVVAQNIFEKMAKFAEYGFNKSHAAAYALIAYQTAYLKAHYPVEFMAATMTLDKTNTDKLAEFIGDAKAMKIPVLPPDINASEPDFSVEDGAVRYALSAVKNVGEAAMRVIVAERAAGGPFASVSDFLKRVDASALNKRYLEHLFKAGAFDALEKNRAKLAHNLETILAYAAGETTRKNSAQIGLFGADSSVSRLVLADCAPWSALEQVAQEKAAFGFYLSAHPLDSYQTAYDRLRIAGSADIAGLVKAAGGPIRVQLGGIIQDVRKKISKKGNQFAIISATDKDGAYDVMCWSDLLVLHRDILKAGGQPLLFTIMASHRPDDDSLRLTLQGVEPLAEAMAKTTSAIILVLDNASAVARIQEVLKTAAPGRNKVFITAKTNGADVDIELPRTYDITAEMVGALQSIPHIAAVKMV